MPHLSESTNAMITTDLREVIGSSEVDVPTDRRRPSVGDDVPHHRALPLPVPLPNNFVIGQVGAVFVVVGAIWALTVGVHRWWALALAVLILVAMLYFVVAMIMHMVSNPERPSETTVAAMEQEGISDPETLFSDIVFEFTPEDDGGVGGDRHASVEDSPLQADAEQRDSTTATGGKSQSVGP